MHLDPKTIPNDILKGQYGGSCQYSQKLGGVVFKDNNNKNFACLRRYSYDDSIGFAALTMGVVTFPEAFAENENPQVKKRGRPAIHQRQKARTARLANARDCTIDNIASLLLNACDILQVNLAKETIAVEPCFARTLESNLDGAIKLAKERQRGHIAGMWPHERELFWSAKKQANPTAVQ